MALFLLFQPKQKISGDDRQVYGSSLENQHSFLELLRVEILLSPFNVDPF